MLRAHGIPFQYRDYRRDPLSESELGLLVQQLGVRAGVLLRPNDPAFKRLGLTGAEPDAVLLPLMVRFPTLLARPIGVVGDRAVVGRPPERLLDLASG